MNSYDNFLLNFKINKLLFFSSSYSFVEFFGLIFQISKVFDIFRLKFNQILEIFPKIKKDEKDMGQFLKYLIYFCF